ncbi:Endonuclease/exonuclease/phosphatase [Lipomyces kononenkoae]|uniref:Endonuclease/exonuclease/phosphatase n=1 Tax=Lipomyces kononenkoae TaxID=34357 RepID=A0ACC3T605_LIPKO
MPKQDGNKKKGGGRPDYVTPEYIAAQRAKREQAKAEKARRNQMLGIEPDEQEGFNTNFIKRPMLAIKDDDETDDNSSSSSSGGVDIKIMTYNVLGQALIRRELFPTNGDALKWRWRSKMLLSELKHYDADIMCLQEVDLSHMDSFYDPELRGLGYDLVYVRGQGKNHGLVICWRDSICRLVRSESVVYDDDDESTKPQTRTRNVGAMAALRFTSAAGGLIIATTHLFWHPHGTFERTRQSAILVRRTKKFAAETDDTARWPVFLAGDFNSEPIDSPYLCLTQARASRQTAHSYGVLCRSWQHKYTNEDLAEDETDRPEETGDTPETADSLSDEQQQQDQAIAAIVRLHDENGVVLRSLYGAYYRRVHPANADVAGRNGEPAFSNWAFTWRGLLDYIFVMATAAHDDSSSSSGQAGEIVPGVRVNALLRLPEPKEMGDEPSGQPREGQYPSDHLCLMAAVKIGHL